MGAVDMCDQMLEPYASACKTLAWFKKLGLHMIDRMILNGFKVFANTRQGYIRTLLEFTREVVNELLKE